jgi:hypothetical protein
MLMSNKTRILEIKEGPFSWTERDILTAVEKYMGDAVVFPLVEYAAPCFNDLDAASIKKIAQIWRYLSASFHLQQITKSDVKNNIDVIKHKAARIYEQEAQRILGSLFPLEHKFWTVFYSRQEINNDKLLVAIDALFYSADTKNQISYQLLLQSIKAIAKGYYATHRIKKKHFEDAKRLIIDLPLAPLGLWINAQLNK